MPSYKEQNGKWYCKFYYTDYKGGKKQKLKRGFDRKKDADAWERDYLQRLAKSPDMDFCALTAAYLEDKKASCKPATYATKRNRINLWLLPAFSGRAVNAITAADVRRWQSDLTGAKTGKGKPLSDSYIRILSSELSGVLQYAVKYYSLPVNPCGAAGQIVKKPHMEMQFWTHEQFRTFIAGVPAADPYYAAFMVLYYTGMRRGELLALTVEDITPDAIRINKTYNIIDGKEVINAPKTAAGNRSVIIPAFLYEQIRQHMGRIYGAASKTRLFSMVTRSGLARRLDKYGAAAGLPRIRVHDLRHSHASLLIEMGFSALLVSERLGHENVTTTLNIYAHLFPSRQSEVAEKLQALYNNSVVSHN